MDQRHTQIREGAGLEESRLNQDFIDFLKKWSTPALLVVALISVAYFLYQRVEQGRKNRIEEAYLQLSQTANVPNPSPEALKQLAADFEGVGAVAEMARLRAADVYLKSVRIGLKVGVNTTPGPTSSLNEDGTLKNAEDAATPEDRERYLSESRLLYQAVVDATRGRAGRELLAINALFGLAAVAESSGKPGDAASAYNEISRIAAAASLPAHADLAKARAADAQTLGAAPKLYSIAELPKKPEPPTPPTAPTDNSPKLDLGGILGPNPATPAPPPEAPAPAQPNPDAPKPDAPKPDAPQPDQPAPETPANPAPTEPPANTPAPPAPPPGQ